MHRRSPWRSARNVLAVLFWIAVFGILGLTCIPRVAGFQTFVLSGHSMTGSINYGSLVVSKPVAVRTLKRGDIVTFDPSWSPRPVTHRIVKIERRNNRLAFWTKGDANRERDPAAQSFSRRVDLYRLHIPFVGWALWALDRFGFLLLGIPAFAIGLMEMIKLWRESAPDLVPELYNVRAELLRGIR